MATYNTEIEINSESIDASCENNYDTPCKKRKKHKKKYAYQNNCKQPKYCDSKYIVLSGPPGERGCVGPRGCPGPVGPPGSVEGIIGPTGATGANGDSGLVLAGSGPPTMYPNTTAGAMYFDKTTGNVFFYTNKWNYTANIIGPQGPQGITGATGVTGDTGVTGATGSSNCCDPYYNICPYPRSVYGDINDIIISANQTLLNINLELTGDSAIISLNALGQFSSGGNIVSANNDGYILFTIRRNLQNILNFRIPFRDGDDYWIGGGTRQITLNGNSLITVIAQISIDTVNAVVDNSLNSLPTYYVSLTAQY